MFQNGVDILCAIVSHIGNSSGLLLEFVLEILYLIFLLNDNSIEELMLIECLIEFDVLIDSCNERFEVFDSLAVVKGLGYNLSQLYMQIGVF